MHFYLVWEGRNRDSLTFFNVSRTDFSYSQRGMENLFYGGEPTNDEQFEKYFSVGIYSQGNSAKKIAGINFKSIQKFIPMQSSLQLLHSNYFSAH